MRCSTLVSGVLLLQVVINEVLYDPAGPDGGWEFVELYNCGAEQVGLSGWRLEGGNGARPNDWRSQWEGRDGDVIAPGDFFLVVGTSRPEAGDARAPLALQNGPDAVRLCSPAGVADLIGWGSLESNEYYEESPAEDVPSGVALARRPDGNDTDCNASDLFATDHLTPGASNVPARCVTVSDFVCDPPVLDPGRSAECRMRVRNCGVDTLDLAVFSVAAVSECLTVAQSNNASERIPPSGESELAWSLSPSCANGADTLKISWTETGTPVMSAGVRIGRGEIIISEVLYDDGGKGGEWIELRNISSKRIDVAGWSIADGSGRAVTLGPGPAVIEPADCRVIAEDPLALAAMWPALAESLLIPYEGAWPGLNNSLDRERGYADEIVVREPGGLASDFVRYRPSELDGKGVSLERWIENGRLMDPGLLVPCPDPRGVTPGGSSWAASRPDHDAGWLNVEPQAFHPDRDDEQRYCRLRIPAGAGGAITADVFSLDGKRVATLAAGVGTNGPLALVWDGSDASGVPLDTGLYMIRVVSKSASEGHSARLCPVALIRGR